MRELRKLYDRNGYVRLLNPKRKKQNRNRKKNQPLYKKGNEVRLVAWTQDQLAHIRKLLRRAGFKPGKPFVKANQFRQPVYGIKQTARFLAMVSEG